ncbi:ABC transporter substrate-binding protein [Vibrio sp. ZSDE26]|uniref:ABC transporter substrate-binding protein n=1 Tax=Vibrio amylolyticus TaxID=2847292 RepID=A0A9X1XH78_9VIBR|nr:ABC transporter substrate-binding protein [Vibrio amylolyticus]MCK6261658.1 ABC transporter substrate-binding protein [Vibrio amylolyticus]
MRAIQRIAFLSLIFFCSVGSASELNDLNFLTEEYPPYNYSNGNEIQGIAVDLLIEASVIAKSEIQRKQISMKPWARAYRTTLITDDTVLFSTTRTKLREHLFQWVGPVSTTKIVVIAKKTSNIEVTEATDLIQYRIGVIRDDVGEQLLTELGVPRDSLQESSYARTIAGQLEKGRIDLWAYEENVANWWISQAGFNTDDYESVFVLQEGELYYAFNKDVENILIEKLQQAIDKVKTNVNNDGLTQYDAIVNKYR